MESSMMVGLVSKAARMIHKPVAICSVGTNRTRAIGICDLRRSEAQPVMPRTRAHLWASKYLCSRESMKFEQINSIRLGDTHAHPRNTESELF